MLDYLLTEDQVMIRDTARDVAEKVLAPRAAELDRGRISRAADISHTGR